jgi:hypothetical protein
MEQKKLAVISMVFVVAAAVVVNEMVIRAKSQDLNREVASFGQRFEPEQIKWEQELAKTVSTASDGKTVIGSKPSLSEKFLFEALEGKYDAKVVDGKILRISLLQNQMGINFSSVDVFKKYSGVFKDASRFEGLPLENGVEKVLLKNSEDRQIGQVTVRRDSDGRIVDIEIQ